MSLLSVPRVQRAIASLTAGAALAAGLTLAATPALAQDPGSHPRSLATVGSRVLWLADDGDHGEELWRTNGTATSLLKDFNPGPDSSGAGLFLVGATKAWYIAFDGTDLQLWRTNGTPGGTVGLGAISPGGSGITIGDRAYYPAYADPTGVELYTSDGTKAGTKRLTDLVPGVDPGVLNIPFARIGSRVAFVGFGADAAPELFTSGSTRRTTARLTQLPTTASIDWLESARGRIYLEVQPSSGTYELWKSDGTKAGTVKVRSLPGPVQARAAVGSSLYFSVAADPVHGAELWRSDGTAATTRLVRDIVPGSEGSNPGRIVRLGTGVVFTTIGSMGSRLWRSDGTKAGTTIIKRINPDGDSTITGLVPVGDRISFFADDGTHGLEPWVTDGTKAGTRLIKNVFPGAGDSLTSGDPEFAGLGGKVYFAADDGPHGLEVWRTTATGATLWADLGPN